MGTPQPPPVETTDDETRWLAEVAREYHRRRGRHALALLAVTGVMLVPFWAHWWQPVFDWVVPVMGILGPVLIMATVAGLGLFSSILLSARLLRCPACGAVATGRATRWRAVERCAGCGVGLGVVLSARTGRIR